MSGRGNKASMPPPSHRRWPTLDETGLVVRPVSQDGKVLGTWDFSDLPGPVSLRRELAAVFDARARSRWNSFKSCDTYATTLRAFVKAMAKRVGPPASVGELTLEAWESWAGGERLAAVRQMEQLLRDHADLAAEVVTAMSKRRTRTEKVEKEGFTRAEMKQIRYAAAGTVRRARVRIRENAAVLERWRAGLIPSEDPDWVFGELLDHLARTADLPRWPGGAPRASALEVFRQRVGGGYAAAVAALFPTVSEKAAAVVLLICHEGWNLSVLERMVVPGQWPNGDGEEDEPVIHRVDTDKPRRGRRRHSSSNLVNLGEGTSGWAMQAVIDMTGQARATLAYLGQQPTDLLLWSRNGRSRYLFSNVSGSDMFSAIGIWADQIRAAGSPLPAGVTPRRLRHTAQVLFGGPRNNTGAVHENEYERRDAAVIESSRDVVASALEEAVRHARESVLMRVAADGYGEGGEAAAVAARTGLSLEAAGRVVRGELDTAVAACEDISNRPIAPTGPCTMSFLLCFACPNAVATRRHLPRIVYLFQALEARRSVVSSAVWAADWAGHHTRIGHLLNTHTDFGDRPALAAAATAREKNLIDSVLERRLQP
ncbi:hypothetical protein ACFWBI_22825 [Streptomyces sp. NPDC059982]|uniref:hypothetical protein n=1 Tax=unclassified Streptomyces TaxID=2593676 RepID=UPI0036CA6C3D